MASSRDNMIKFLAIGSAVAAGYFFMYAQGPNEALAQRKKQYISASQQPISKESPRNLTVEPEKSEKSTPQPSATEQIKQEEVKPVSLNSMETIVSLGIPKVGEGTELQPDYGSALQLFAQRTVDGGYGVGFIDMYGTPIVIVTDPEIVRKTLSHNVQHALWAGLTAASTAFFGKMVLFVLEGDQWRFLRSIIKQALTQQSVKLMQLDLIEIAAKFTNKINSGVEVDLNSLLGLYHLSAIGKSAFNYDLDCLEADDLGPNAIAKAFEFFIDEMPKRSLNPDQTVAGDYVSENVDNAKWKEAAKTVRQTIYNVICNRFADYGYQITNVDNSGSNYDREQNVLNLKDVTKRNDLLDCMIFAYIAQKYSSADNSKTLNENEDVAFIDFNIIGIDDLIETLSDNLVEILFAGYNTNVGTIANCLHYLALHPTVQQEAHSEVVKFMELAEVTDINNSSQFSKFNDKFDLKHFSVLQNCFYETLRLRPPAPLVARLTTKEVVITSATEPLKQSVVLPKGFSVWFPSEYLQKHPDNWYNNETNDFDPTEFIPNRFNVPDPYKQGSFLPFSSGPRDCIGKNFAVNEAVIALISLLYKFEFNLSADYKYKSFFNGFGYRPYDETSDRVCMRLIPVLRQEPAEKKGAKVEKELENKVPNKGQRKKSGKKKRNPNPVNSTSS